MKHIIEYSHQDKYYDEYYTTMDEVEYIFEKVLPKDVLEGKTVYCPCDSDNSAFVIYLKAHKDDLRYKTLIYTADDFNTHEDIFNEADIVITNPPFSLTRSHLMKLIKKDFFLFVGKTFLKYNLNGYYYDTKFKRFDTECKFEKTNDFHIDVPHLYYASFRCNIQHTPPQPYKKCIDIQKIYGVLKDGRKALNIDKIKDIPTDYDDYMLVPITVLIQPTTDKFDIIGRADVTQYTDGRNRFIRYLVKWK